MKKIIVSILVLVVCAAILCMASAETDGNVTWSISDDNILTVSCSGDWPEYTQRIAPPWRASGAVAVEIEDGTATVGDYAFYNMPALARATLPDSVTAIGNYAFGWCDKLQTVTLGENVETLGQGCFSECALLDGVVLPDTITGIGDACFENCAALDRIAIPAGVKSLGNWCFMGCTSLENVALPDGMTTLGQSCFNNCASLLGIDVPQTVTAIGTRCFAGCKSLKSVSLPGVRMLDDLTFFNCTALTSVIIPEGVTALGKMCFSGCTSLCEIVLSTTLSTVGDDCFESCAALERAYCYDASALEIDAGNECLTDVMIVMDILYLPDDLKELGAESLSGAKMHVVVVPASVETIASAAFRNCSNLRMIRFDGDPDVADDILDARPGIVVYAPEGTRIRAWAEAKGCIVAP